ncbi:ankyrin repeat-containing domain protein [Pavlovales sp. CCMP2436]|nr:ankyrin repeat-containing domain protein [Pavlovales sp. CCMP2436]
MHFVEWDSVAAGNDPDARFVLNATEVRAVNVKLNLVPPVGRPLVVSRARRSGVQPPAPEAPTIWELPRKVHGEILATLWRWSLLDALPHAAQGRTALKVASIQGHAECARLLLEAGADANHADLEGRTALTAASSQGHIECSRLLLMAGTDVNHADEAGADANHTNVNGATVLMYASVRGHVEFARLLLEADADLLCAYGAQREGLHSRTPADIHAWVLETSRWNTPLHHLELLPPARVRQLLVGGADVHASNGSGDGAPTPLGLARVLLARDPAHEGASLVVAAAAPWSRENHALFPAHVRARAAELLRLGQLLVREARFAGEEIALLDVWPLGAPARLGGGHWRAQLNQSKLAPSGVREPAGQRRGASHPRLRLSPAAFLALLGWD